MGSDRLHLHSWCQYSIPARDDVVLVGVRSPRVMSASSTSLITFTAGEWKNGYGLTTAGFQGASRT
jgi:hypothetical protein